MPKYKIADVIWDICPEQENTKNLLKDYEVVMQNADVKVPAMNQDEIPEHMQLLQYINEQLAGKYQGIMIHAAAIVYRQKAYLFAATPGTGKTTHICLWKQVLGDEALVLNGDKPFIRIKDDQILVYGGPWRGKERLGCNEVYPLGGVYLLRRGQENRVCKTVFGERLQGLLDSVLLCAEHESMVSTMNILNAICKTVPVATLHCNMEKDAVYTVLKHIEEGDHEN